LRFGAARSDIVSLPISVDTLPIRIGPLQFRVGAIQIHCGTLSFVCTLCGLWNENSRFLIESGELSLQRSELRKGQWFKRKALPQIPGKVSLARQLIDRWIDQKL